MARFRLARLLHLRGQLRGLRQLEAQRIELERERLDSARDALQEGRQVLLEQSRAALAQGPLPAADLAVFGHYDDALQARTTELERRLADANQRLVAKRAEVASERREERKLENLAERHHDACAREAALAEDRLLDELALARHVRDGGEGRRGD
jgi:flagellar export protein FliJ